MPDYREIYRTQARQYDRLVAREDAQGNIWKALRRIRPFHGLDVVELGAGTGRLTCLLAPAVENICAFDISAHMLESALNKLTALGLRNWRAAVADNRRLPIGDAVADVTIAGWTLGHFVSWYPDTWRREIASVLGQMQRALRPEGTAIVLETLGTGRETPQPPNAGLAAYYAYLEQGRGFCSTWIRTDYRFQSLAEAAQLTRFFFGDELAGRVEREGLICLPECTGIWWSHAS
jgi:ubiquinone/menaquinone biosynthesis C-methylase UbiE